MCRVEAPGYVFGKSLGPFVLLDTVALQDTSAGVLGVRFIQSCRV